MKPSTSPAKHAAPFSALSKRNVLVCAATIQSVWAQQSEILLQSFDRSTPCIHDHHTGTHLIDWHDNASEFVLHSARSVHGHSVESSLQVLARGNNWRCRYCGYRYGKGSGLWIFLELQLLDDLCVLHIVWSFLTQRPTKKSCSGYQIVAKNIHAGDARSLEKWQYKQLTGRFALTWCSLARFCRSFRAIVSSCLTSKSNLCVTRAIMTECKLLRLSFPET